MGRIVPDNTDAYRALTSPIPLDIETIKRFKRLVGEPDINGCMNWQGFIHPKGYGYFGISGGTKRRAHRIAYTIARGPIPEGMVLDHLCRNRACVNPDHLEAITAQENSRRGLCGINSASKTHCPQGHEYTPENTGVDYKRRYPCRYCRECKRQRDREAKRRSRLAAKKEVPS